MTAAAIALIYLHLVVLIAVHLAPDEQWDIFDG